MGKAGQKHLTQGGFDMKNRFCIVLVSTYISLCWSVWLLALLTAKAEYSPS